MDGDRLVFFVLDQSDSMHRPVARGISGALASVRATRAAAAALWAGRGASAAGEAWVGILAYGSRMGPLSVERQEHPVRGGGPRTRRPMPLSVSSLGATGTCAALGRARAAVRAWAREHGSGRRPIVIHFTDGQSTDGDPAGAARALCSTGTAHGSTLLVNVVVTGAGGRPVRFPIRSSELPGPIARKAFELSSEIPAPIVRRLRAAGLRVRAGARGLVVGWNVTSVVTAVVLATSGVRPGGTGREEGR